MIKLKQIWCVFVILIFRVPENKDKLFLNDTLYLNLIKKTKKKNNFYSKKLSLFSVYLFLRIRRGDFLFHQNSQKILYPYFSSIIFFFVFLVRRIGCYRWPWCRVTRQRQKRKNRCVLLQWNNEETHGSSCRWILPRWMRKKILYCRSPSGKWQSYQQAFVKQKKKKTLPLPTQTTTVTKKMKNNEFCKWLL